ncbi:putative nuclease HARBI1 [Bradysia coprophila]|uniref:putative nuclease HARBI1 n=1 Tax=Bradysia coprophila TaxID=38358 RepID=UPI00187DC973|nr:putative nuclease HARBI1 [Bradysia coprophila]
MFNLSAYEYHRNKVYMAVTRRSLRDTLDPFDTPDERFIEMYRFTRCLALDFLDLLKVHMNDINCCPEIPLTIQFCATLNFYASGSYQRRVSADGMAMISQSVVSRCVRSISYAIATRMIDEHIRFPQTLAEVKMLHDELQNHSDFPGCFAIVDGSHIALSALPKLIEFAFLNRKGFHSLNTQFVVSTQLRILNVNARYSGSTHDALIWRSSLANSTLKRMSERHGQEWKYYLIGDHGYPLQPWLLKPYDTPCNWAETVFNSRLRKLRSLVERVIGLLKARFRCLLNERKLRYKPLISGYIIYSCSVLHNFLIDNDYPVDNIEPIFDDEVENYNVDMVINCNELERGRRIRDGVAINFVN